MYGYIFFPGDHDAPLSEHGPEAVVRDQSPHNFRRCQSLQHQEELAEVKPFIAVDTIYVDTIFGYVHHFWRHHLCRHHLC